MGTQYNFSVKDAEDAPSVDAGIEGWDAVIQINNVVSRRYAASTPMSLISRIVDFRGTNVDGGTGGIQLGTSGYLPLLDIGSLSSGTSNAKNLLFIPTMVGLMVHPQTTGAMSNTFAGSIAVKSASGSITALLTSSFPLTPSASSLSSASINGVNTMNLVSNNNFGVIVQPTSAALPGLGLGSSRKGYYYLCPINRGWLQHSVGNACGGMPLRGFTIQNDSISPFIPDGATGNTDIPYAGFAPFTQIGLIANGGTNDARFAIVDLYGIIIPSASAAV